MLVRITVLIAMLTFCIALPFFSPVLSMVGALPETTLTIIIPISLYLKQFETSIFTKYFLVTLIGIATSIMIGNMVFSIADIIKISSRHI